MKHIFEYKMNEHKDFDSRKGNIRSAYVQAPFITLKDLSQNLPEPCSFDIEISKPFLPIKTKTFVDMT